MTNFINWLQESQPIKGDVLPGQGNAVADYESPASGVASGVAPEGAQYAMVWTDNVNGSIVEASNLTTERTGGFSDGKKIAIPTQFILEVFNVTPKKTQITMTDI